MYKHKSTLSFFFGIFLIFTNYERKPFFIASVWPLHCRGPPIIGGKARWKFQKFPQKCSDWPQNYHFCSAKSKYTNKLCHNSFPGHETGYFLPTVIHSLIPFLAERIIWSVNDDGILRSHWFEQVSSVQDNIQMRNSENSSGRGVAPQSWIFFGNVYAMFSWPTESRKDVPMM